MAPDDQLPDFDEPEPIQSGHPGGKVLQLGEDDSDFILELLNQIIERLDGIESVLSQMKEHRSAAGVHIDAAGTP